MTVATREPIAHRGELSKELVSEVWLAFIAYCRQLGHGEIQSLKIQDGLPVMAEVVTKKVKFSPTGSGNR